MPTSAPRLERAASWMLQLGAILVVLAALPYKTFELDRFFVPKELVLHATALAVALLLLDRASRAAFGRVDALLAGFLALSAVSAALSTNRWLGLRALAISLSGVTLFWAARTLARAGLARRLLTGLVVAVLVGACTGLAQAYGVVSEGLTEYLSLARAPGGTFGNRNFLAHLAAIGLPSLLYLALTARRAGGATLGGVGLVLLSAAIFLSRTRAAWLALIVASGLLALGALWRRSVLRERRTTRRAAWLALCLAAGVAGALFLPNELNWKSDNPYLESATGVVNYKEGSGRGRLIQYQNSGRMALTHPVLGVGPGNWPVAYPRHAAPDDPSLGSDGMTSNPWPSSDWVAFVSERGALATALLLLSFVGIALSGAIALREARRADEALVALALTGTVVVTVIVGIFDAVLLLAAPSLIAWSLLGVLCPLCVPGAAGATRTPPARPAQHRPAVMAAVGVIGAVLVVRSTSQALAMGIADGSFTPSTLTWAARVDPGSYRIRIRAAEAFARRGRCTQARAHAGAARDLFPDAPAPRRVLRRCT